MYTLYDVFIDSIILLQATEGTYTIDSIGSETFKFIIAAGG